MSSSEQDKPIQVILTGIGGQGILFATKILAECGLRAGLRVIGSETHGMSQRGGSVTSHLKLGACRSPLVRPGNADALVALEANEAYRAMRFLRPARDGKRGGVMLVNSGEGFPRPEVRAALSDAGVGVGVIDASALACSLGSPVVVNLVILGFASADTRFPFTFAQVKETVGAVSPPRFAELNGRALTEGHSLGEQCLASSPLTTSAL